MKIPQPLLVRAPAVRRRRQILTLLWLGLALAAGRASAAAAQAAASSAATSQPAASSPAPATAAEPANGQAAVQATAPTAAPPPAGGDQGATTPPTTAATPPTMAAPVEGTSPAGPATPAAPAPGTAPPATAAPPAPAQGTATPSGTSGSGKKTKGKSKDTGKPAKPVKPPPPPPKPPLPNKELLRLKPFTGVWTCVGRTFGPGPEHPTAATMSFTWQSDGFWLEARYEELRGVATNPVPVSWTALWVFDDLQAGVSSLGVDNEGGSATQVAAGWQGEKLIFEGPGHRFATQFVDRDIYVLHGDGQFLHTQEVNVNENWIKLHDDTCTRSTAK